MLTKSWLQVFISFCTLVHLAYIEYVQCISHWGRGCFVFWTVVSGKHMTMSNLTTSFHSFGSMSRTEQCHSKGVGGGEQLDCWLILLLWDGGWWHQKNSFLMRSHIASQLHHLVVMMMPFLPCDFWCLKHIKLTVYNFSTENSMLQFDRIACFSLTWLSVGTSCSKSFV